MDAESARPRALASALGPELAALLADPSLTELAVNPDGAVWSERLGAGAAREPLTLAPRQTEAILAHAAGEAGATLHDERPLFEGRLPGSPLRIAGAIPPASPEGPLLAIRKPPATAWPLGAYFAAPRGAAVGRGAAPPPRRGLLATLEWALAERRNIVVSGGTSTAKTSLLAAALERLAGRGAGGRLVLLEEGHPELALPAGLNAARLVTAPQAVPPVGLAELVRLALRLNPDRIVVGESRGGEALPLLRSWATGHDGGLTSVHASTAEDTLHRLEDLLSEAGLAAPRPLVARTVHLVVHLRYFHPGERVVTEVLRVEGLDERHRYRLATVEPEEGSTR